MKNLSKIFVMLLVMITMSLLLPPLANALNTGEIAMVEDSDGTILEPWTASMPNVFLSKVACAFYNSGYNDQYEALFVFNFTVTNIQQGWSVQNPTEGIGRYIFDDTASFCADEHRLRITVNMGNIMTLPFNPDEVANIVPFYPLTGIELMGHEFGHHWLSAVNFDKGDGEGMQCLLRGFEPSGGQDARRAGSRNTECNGENATDFNQHWSYFYDSCSLMYGSCIEDLGDGNFRFSYNNPKYSELDQYLMGLRSAHEVSPMFLVDTGDFIGSASIPLQHGQSAERTGTRVDLTIEDIIRNEGERNPAEDICHWKAAFIIVHPAGMPPTQAQIDQVDNYRRRWEEFYPWATDNRGSFDTTLDGCGRGTPQCPGEIEPSCDAPLCLEGERRCQGVLVMECENEQWVMAEECVHPSRCESGVCVGETPADGDGDDSFMEDESEAVLCHPEENFCEGNVYHFCPEGGGRERLTNDCAARGLRCDAELGCIEMVDGDTDALDGDEEENSGEADNQATGEDVAGDSDASQSEANDETVKDDNPAKGGCRTTNHLNAWLFALLGFFAIRKKKNRYGLASGSFR